MKKSKSISINGLIVKSISIDGITMWKKQEIPNGYTELEAARSNGSLWIDTHWKPNLIDSKVEFKCSNISNGSVFGGFGFHNGVEVNSFTFYYHGFYFADTNGGNNIIFTVPNTDFYEGQMECKDYHYVITCNDISGENIASGNHELVQDIYLFAQGYNNRPRDYSSSNIHYFRAWEYGVSVLDLRPVRRDADGVVGFYNVVNGEFLTPMPLNKQLIEIPKEEQP